jgi:hypothetical protein
VPCTNVPESQVRYVTIVNETDIIERFGVPPRHEDLPEIRHELAVATELAHSDNDAGDTLVMKALCFLLVTAGQVEDSIAIWRAKTASFDAQCSIDVQLLCGAGFDETRRYLERIDSNEARAALSYLMECDGAGDFEGHDEPGGRLAELIASYQRYYGLTE